MWRFLQPFLNNNAGVAAVEFALTIPMLLTLFYGGFEVSRYMLIAQKVEKLAAASADVVAQSDQVTNTELASLLGATSSIMKPYTFGANGVVIISSLYRAAGSTTVKIAWQRSGGGSLVAQSKLGAAGATPVLPTGFTLNERDNVIVAEVYYSFVPLFTGQVLAPSTIYQRAFYKPRLGALNQAPS